MIATVLLIAFTIGVGGLISVFMTGITTTSTGITSNQSDSLTRCAGAWINVYRATNSTVYYQNPTGQTITGLVIISSDGVALQPADPGLTAGESNYTTIGVNSTVAGVSGLIPGGSTSGNISVTVRGLCLSTVTVEGSCKRGQACWQV